MDRCGSGLDWHIRSHLGNVLYLGRRNVAHCVQLDMNMVLTTSVMLDLRHLKDFLNRVYLWDLNNSLDGVYLRHLNVLDNRHVNDTIQILNFRHLNSFLNRVYLRHFNMLHDRNILNAIDVLDLWHLHMSLYSV